MEIVGQDPAERLGGLADREVMILLLYHLVEGSSQQLEVVVLRDQPCLDHSLELGRSQAVRTMARVDCSNLGRHGACSCRGLLEMVLTRPALALLRSLSPAPGRSSARCGCSCE